MSSKSITTAEKHEASPGELNQRVEQLQKKIDDRNESVATSQRLQSQLATEREALVLPARVEGDAGAQKRLREIDVQLAGVRRNISDDATAIAELGAQLTAAEQAVELAEWEERRAKVRSLLIARMRSNLGGKIQKAATDLAAALDAAKEKDDQIKAEILKFEPRKSLGFGISDLRGLRKHGVMFELMRQLEIETQAFYGSRAYRRDMAADDQKYFGQALEALDSLELVF